MINLIAKIVGSIGINPKEAERFTKFLIVGTLGFVIDFGTLTLLVEIVGLPELISERMGYQATFGLILANTISFTMAVISNFTFNRYWTYPESRNKRKRVQLPQFTAVSIVGLILNNGILALTVSPFDRLLDNLEMSLTIDGYIPAKIVATIVVLFWNFFVNRFWTYSNVK